LVIGFSLSTGCVTASQKFWRVSFRFL